MGSLLTKQKRYEEAIEVRLRGVELDPEDADARYNLGNSYARVGRIAEAREAWEQTLKSDDEEVVRMAKKALKNISS